MVFLQVHPGMFFYHSLFEHETEFTRSWSRVDKAPNILFSALMKTFNIFLIKDYSISIKMKVINTSFRLRH